MFLENRSYITYVRRENMSKSRVLDNNIRIRLQLDIVQSRVEVDKMARPIHDGEYIGNIEGQL